MEWTSYDVTRRSSAATRSLPGNVCPKPSPRQLFTRFRDFEPFDVIGAVETMNLPCI
jgi:hypothetical protein